MKRTFLPLLFVSAITLVGCGSKDTDSSKTTTVKSPPSVSVSDHMSPEAQAAKAAAGGH